MLSRLSSSFQSKKVCIIGSGPGGFYTASHLIKYAEQQQEKGNKVHLEIDMYEKWPTPFGLVRYGVAPDHPEVKNVIHKFESIAQHPPHPAYTFKWMGNTGNLLPSSKGISLDTLHTCYDAVVLAYGCNEDKDLYLPTESSSLTAIKSCVNVSARQFVGWYNGHPDMIHLFDKNAFTNMTDVVVVGMGNVAMDVCRILLSPLDLLEKTDITRQALETLSYSNIKNVHVMARRGPLQAAFTTKEFKEIMSIPNIVFKTNVEWMRSYKEQDSVKSLLSKNRAKRRLFETVCKHLDHAQELSSHTDPAKKTFNLHFLKSPFAFLKGPCGHISGLKVQHNQLLENGGIQPLQEYQSIPTQMLIKSIGYKAEAIPGIPLDQKTGCVPNQQGRVLVRDTVLPGLYVAGWLKTGPVGVIASTLQEAYGTAESIIQDFQLNPTSSKKLGYSGLEPLFKQQGASIIQFQDWKKIDREEEKRGQLYGKPREKVVNVEEMLELALYCRKSVT